MSNLKNAGSIETVNSLFQQPWWLDAVALNGWEEILLKREGKVVARLPFVIKQKYGCRIVGHPPLTQTLGPWLAPTDLRYEKKLSYERELIQSLIDRLPKFDLFQQNASPDITNWLPFYWNGFRQTTSYTYRINDLLNIDSLWNELNSSVRRSIRKALKHVVVRDDLGIDRFLELAHMTCKRKDRQLGVPDEVFYRIDEACQVRNAHKLYFAEDSTGNVHASLFLIHDARTTYYLMGGINPSFANSGAQSLLMWTAIKFASRHSKCFDFEGSMDASVERFFRKFGSRQVPLFRIVKFDNRLKPVNSLLNYLQY